MIKGACFEKSFVQKIVFLDKIEYIQHEILAAEDETYLH